MSGDESAGNQTPGRPIVDPQAPAYRPARKLRRAAIRSKVRGTFKRNLGPADILNDPYMVPYILDVMQHRVSTYLFPSSVPGEVIRRGASLLGLVFAKGCEADGAEPLYTPSVETIQEMTDNLVTLDGAVFCARYGVADFYAMMTKQSRG